VIGKEFPFSLLRQVVSQPEDALHRLLAHLQAAEFIYEQPAFPEVEYTFKHALTQEVAYGSLLLERRKVLHERTAQAIESLFHSKLDEHYSELAHHYHRSGNTQKAVEYLQLAGQQAVRRSAHAEAISHFTTALELLRSLPDVLERIQQELTLQIALAAPLRAIKGYAAPEVGQAYTRARELCRQVGETPQLFPALLGLRVSYQLRGELLTARELGEQLLGLAQSAQDPALLIEAHRALGAPLFWLGEVASAQAHMEQVIALYDPQQHRSHVFLYGLDPGVFGLSYMALILWTLGYPDQALKRGHEAFALAQELSYPFSLASALHFAAWLHQLRREGQLTRERAEVTAVLSAEQGFAYELAGGNVLGGWALADQGQGEEGIAQMRQGLAAWRAAGVESPLPHFLALLAEAYGKVGQPEEGLAVLAEALAVAHKNGERVSEAELYRIKGELSLQSPSPKSEVEESLESGVRSSESEVKTSLGQVQDKSKASLEQVTTSQGKSQASLETEAEACFMKAIDIARKQQAKSLELRATTSLARLWQRQGKQHEARNMLSEIYGWFTEGFDTKDLQEAKALLEELS
jgi:predicted ATPase